MSRFASRSAALVLAAAMAGDVAAETIKITKIESGKSKAGVGVNVYFEGTGTASKDYHYRLEAKEQGKDAIVLEGNGKTTAGADGKIKDAFKNNAAPLKVGVKYTITLKLFKFGDDTANGTPLATDAMDHTISSDPYPGEDPDEPPPPPPPPPPPLAMRRTGVDSAVFTRQTPTSAIALIVLRLV